jgi:NADPH-dependent 2,4-dienoyl-CoA reductase/sulfur reductase-like enzyme
VVALVVVYLSMFIGVDLRGTPQPPVVVVVGGGLAGLTAALECGTGSSGVEW